jgi:hypothetical protein
MNLVDVFALLSITALALCICICICLRIVRRKVMRARRMMHCLESAVQREVALPAV